MSLSEGNSMTKRKNIGSNTLDGNAKDTSSLNKDEKIETPSFGIPSPPYVRQILLRILV